MRRLIIFAMAALSLVSCGPTAVTSLYWWGGQHDANSTEYEQLAYLSYDKQSPQSICKLISVYEEMVNNPIGTRRVPPPGICAEYGYLLMKEGTVDAFSNYATDKQKSLFNTDDYASVFAQKGVEMFQKEIELYPESAKFLKPLMDKVNGEDQ